MKNYKPPNFKTTNKEIVDALSVLRRYGFNVNLSEELKKRFDNEILFDGDDGLFKELIKDINIYFEYGCGKSTEYIYRYTKSKIFSVDTSKEWTDKIESICDIKTDDRLNLKWIDVGEIENWGHPKSFKMRKNFLEYAIWLWEQDKEPDLVLIDGRFRILCFLTTLKYSPPGTKIIFDDYKERQFYHVVEEFCPIIDRCGRQALFEVNTKAKDKITEEVLLSFQNIII
tara:strand:- start:149 stop:832 length:684 start_codon:yes stop_codon:yes gene_type:complete